MTRRMLALLVIAAAPVVQSTGTLAPVARAAPNDNWTRVAMGSVSDDEFMNLGPLVVGKPGLLVGADVAFEEPCCTVRSEQFDYQSADGITWETYSSPPIDAEAATAWQSGYIAVGRTSSQGGSSQRF